MFTSPDRTGSNYHYYRRMKNMLSKEGDTIKIIMKVEITSISKYGKGFDVRMPNGRITWIDQKDIDSGKIQIEE